MDTNQNVNADNVGTDIEQFIKILEKEMVPALGCTDPVGVAFAAAFARQYLKGEILAIRGEISVNIIKNAAAVCIPRTGGKCGVGFALALGAIAGNSQKGLEVLTDVTVEAVEQAAALLETGAVVLSVSEDPNKLYMKVTVTTAEEEAVVIIKDSYTNVTDVVVNGQVLFLNGTEETDGEDDSSACPAQKAPTAVKTELPYHILSLESIFHFAEEVPLERLGIIKEAVRMNMTIAEEGLAHDYGVSVGKSIQSYMASGSMGEGLASTAMMWVAAATDARMAGCDIPVISNTGSGNQGLVSTVPVISIARKLEVPCEKMLRAVAISSLVTIYIKEKLGALSAVCGAVIAGGGTSCGIVYLLGGGPPQMLAALKSTLGDIAGMLCDGAKAGCAMKVATCTNTGVIAALIAMDNKGIAGTDGIVGRDENQTIDNFIKIATDGMNKMDNVILDIILKKEDSSQ